MPLEQSSTPLAPPRPPGAALIDVPVHQFGGFGQTVSRYGAMLTMFLLGLRQFVHGGTTSGYILAFLLLPVWLGVLGRFRGGRLLSICGLATLVWGYVLCDLSSTDHVVSASVQIASTSLLAGILLGINAVLWARTVLPVAQVGFFYGLGMCANAVMIGTDPSNPWKHTWGIPLGVLVLGAVGLSRRAREQRTSPLGVVALLVLGVISAFSDARSYGATFLIAAILVVWESRPESMSRRSTVYFTSAMLVGIAGATYWLGTKLLVSGYLGADAQARTIAQIDQSGSVILGGRPELQATIALMKAHFMGFGVGIEPSGDDVLVAKAGLASINYDPNNGYVDKFMFGGHVELHSCFGDLWAGWGVLGLLLLVLFAVHLVRAIVTTVTRGVADPLLMFLAVWSAWNLLFSPLYGSAPTLTIGVGLAMAVKAERAGRPPARLLGRGRVDPGAGTDRSGSPGATAGLPVGALT